jgi:hypothetical protein
VILKFRWKTQGHLQLLQDSHVRKKFEWHKPLTPARQAMSELYESRQTNTPPLLKRFRFFQTTVEFLSEDL